LRDDFGSYEDDLPLDLYIYTRIFGPRLRRGLDSILSPGGPLPNVFVFRTDTSESTFMLSSSFDGSWPIEVRGGVKSSRITSRTWENHGLKLLFDRSLRFRNPTVLNAASTNIIITNAEVKYPRVLTLEAAVTDLRI